MEKKIQPYNNEHGQSMVELALMISLLMILLAGTIDLGRAFFTWLAMRDSAQEGATYGTIVHPGADITCDSTTPNPGPQICQRVWDNLGDVIDSPRNNIVINVDVTRTSCSRNSIQVDVNYPNFPLAMPFLGTILGSQTIPIHATINDTIFNPLCP